MFDNTDTKDHLGQDPHLAFASARLPKDSGKDNDTAGEEACLAFGYLRGVGERSLSLQLRYHNGNSDWFPYGWLGPWRYNPSAGLLLKFTGDLVSLVLIRGSNLDAMVNRNSVNLTDRGLQRHRITWIREMDEAELRKARKGEPTIDRIEVAEFESNEQAIAWLKKAAPLFVR